LRGTAPTKALSSLRFASAVQTILCRLVAVMLGVLLTSPHRAAAAPLVSEVRSDEEIVFYPTFATPATNGGWNVPIHGCVFEVEKRRVSLALLRGLLRLDGVSMNKAEAATFRERGRLFFADNERGHRVVIRIGEETFDVGKSAPNGHFATEVHVAARPAQVAAAAVGPLPHPNPTADRLKPELPDDGNSTGDRLRPGLQTVEISAVLKEWDGRKFSGCALVLPAAGVSVVSDVDDTIKISEVRDHKALVRRTFLQPFEAVPGMAALYRGWASNGAAFHYVSASPWQLFPLLDAFAETNGFPAGAWCLKHWRLKDRTFKSLFEDPEKYKVATVGALMRQYPERRFVLVGDSGERDPEAYAALARAFPEQVKAIFIRDVTGEGAEAERYRTNFSEMPHTVWRVFKEPEEIAPLVPR
jgi:hypothetical protein